MTKTRSTAPTGDGVSHECRLWGDPPCADGAESGGRCSTRTAVARVADQRRVHAVLCAGLLVFMAGRPALAQPGAELEIGSGYHAALDLGSDWFTVPSTPTVDVRATRWVSDRWGVAARGLIGLGGVLRGTTWDIERRRPTYFQILVRYRAVGSGRSGLHVGIGGGLWGYIQNDDFDFGPHLLGLEALGSRALTKRLSVRFGASVVIPLHIHPTVLLAWGF